ncbi:MAG: hypothetical protein IPM27_10670 [Nitrosomonadales bacterium]|nr:hypothetical protein [Nitrosomonadales bacterium]
MSTDNPAMDTAARFGEIPFVDFTRDLINGVFDSLVEAHLAQVEQYGDFVRSLTSDLSTYINNTSGNVDFDQIADFVQGFELPEVSDDKIKSVLDKLDSPTTESPQSESMPADESKWWGGLINALAPAVQELAGKVGQREELQAIADYNSGVVEAVPDYQKIHDAIASLISSNKYGLLQTMAKQGMMRLVVTEGEIETKITFSTWSNSASGSSSEEKIKEKNKNKSRDRGPGRLMQLFKRRESSKSSNRTVTVNTAKSYQRDSSGTKVDIFGRVLIRFKTDYAPLNG